MDFSIGEGVHSFRRGFRVELLLIHIERSNVKVFWCFLAQSHRTKEEIKGKKTTRKQKLITKRLHRQVTDRKQL